MHWAGGCVFVPWERLPLRSSAMTANFALHPWPPLTRGLSPKATGGENRMNGFSPSVKNQRFLPIACGRSGRGSDSPPDCHSLPRLRFAYPKGRATLSVKNQRFLPALPKGEPRYCSAPTCLPLWGRWQPVGLTERANRRRSRHRNFAFGILHSQSDCLTVHCQLKKPGPATRLFDYRK